MSFLRSKKDRRCRPRNHDIIGIMDIASLEQVRFLLFRLYVDLFSRSKWKEHISVNRKQQLKERSNNMVFTKICL